MLNRLVVLVGIVIAFARPAAADTTAPPTPPKEAGKEVGKELEVPGEDDVLYSCKEKTGEVSVTFKPETDVKDLVTWVMGFTCKNFVIDPRILSTNRKVTVIAPNKMSVGQAYRVFLVALSTIGLTVVPKGNVMRIVEAKTAKGETLPIYKTVPDDSDQLVRLVVRPTYAQPEALKAAFTAVKSDAGDITVVGSMLVVTDYASNLGGMMSLKKLVDVPGGTEGIYTIPVHHGDATKIAAVLTGMLGITPVAGPPNRAGPPGPMPQPASADASELGPSKILVDDRTNTIVISASEPAYQRAKALVERIDIAVDLEGGNAMHVYPLQSAIAEEIAETLNRAISGDTAPRPTTGPGSGAPTQGSTPPRPSQTTGATPPLDALGQSLQGKVHIMPDNKTNKLLVTSSSHDFLALKDVIRELDQPRRQVYIEAMILEVSADNDVNYGVSAHGGLPGTGLALGGVQLPGLKSTDVTSLASATGLIGGLLGAPLSNSSILGTGTSIPSYGVLVQALATTQNTNILSTPSLIALDNEQATSKIGTNIPYIRGTIPTTNGASTTLTTNIDRQPLELELDIKPHISAGDTVLLEIKHTASDVADKTGTLGPTWTTRDIETRVVVRDQQTVVIGGLMQQRETENVSKVPILGDIPLLGNLFRYTVKEKHKSNLLVMLTPYIIRDQLDIQAIQERKVREHDEFFHSLSSLDAMKFDSRMDYHKKRGLIEEINRSVLGVEEDIVAREALARPSGVPAGPVEVKP